ncbi:MAG TPA: hypothetical protein HA282_02070 [Nanoarchaeota archaeon]|nr:MAG: hypothetical protein QT01_C0002G0082 [archaeon GW2011_AR6]MBS3082674.1 hypothetical protein [Candidatus Pacearchaeota archaeon]HIH18224.1 hypothetical protein [Nanoarchaeota archaeon]HIH34339.1 hypothetical protein [Nanoarchaeota archaeon]HIH50904.1 hypothetical protein [Nanoarchaeota archaeon]
MIGAQDAGRGAGSARRGEGGRELRARGRERGREKRAQEEMLGFAFVIVLVIIIGFVILMLTLRGPSSPLERENTRVNSLLNSITHFTTSCDKESVQQLIIACRNGESSCGEDSCAFVKGEVTKILGQTLAGDFRFSAEVTAEGEEQVLLEIKKEENGECSGKRTSFVASSVLPRRTIIKLVSCPEMSASADSGE